MSLTLLVLALLCAPLHATELPLPFSSTDNVSFGEGDPSSPQHLGTALVLLETTPTHHYLFHFFHLLEHIVGLWSYYGHDHFQDVDWIVLGGDSTIPLAWEGPNQINRHLLQALFPRATVTTGWPPSPVCFQRAVTSDRALAFASPECMRLNKMLGVARHTLSPHALQSLADRVHAYAHTTCLPSSSLRVTYLKRPSPRALSPHVEQALLASLEQHPNLSLSVNDFALLSFREQINLIGNTDLLISVHGNGLSHLLFLPPHAKVIEIFPPASHALDYRLFADARGLPYTGIIADRGVISREEAYLIGPFGDINAPIHELDLTPVLESLR